MPINGKKILIVDDEPDLREILTEQLETFRAIVSEAENGKIAFEKFMSEDFDAILSDMKMPVESGLDLLNNIRKSQKKRPVFMFITAHSDLLPFDLFTLGASAVFEKPYKLSFVTEALERLLKIPHHGWNRSYKRFDLDLKVHFSSDQSNIRKEAQTINLGMKGLGIQTDFPLPMTSELISFELELPSKDKKIAGKGIVRWANPVNKSEVARGFGLEFVDINSNYTKTLENFLYSLDSSGSA